VSCVCNSGKNALSFIGLFNEHHYFCCMKKLITYTLLSFLATQCFGKGIGNGSDGTASISGIVNKYAAVITFNSQNTFSEFTVDTATFFSKGDLVLVIQMQGALANLSNTASYGSIQNFRNTGNYEYVKVDSITGNKVRTTKTQKQYDSTGKIQLVKVPQYKTATVIGDVSGLPWDGKKGGIIAIDAADSIVMQTDIIANHLGFRHGTQTNDPTIPTDDNSYWRSGMPAGMKGEGIAGRGDTSNLILKIYARGSIANGGGGGNNHNAGGGGGANGGCGGFGGWGYFSYVQQSSRGIGGYSLSSAIGSGKIFLGGGGGAGQANDNFLSVPGNGGGIVILSAGTIVGNNNKIMANGGAGSDNNGYDGAGGGGAGGSAMLYADAISNVSIECKGGKGGNPKNFFNQHLTAPGGGGGGGLIRFKDQATVINVTGNVDSGAAGICDTSNFGATDGCPGIIFETLEIEHPPVGVKELAPDKSLILDITLSPNPAKDYVELQLNPSNAYKTQLTVYDVAGRKHYSAVFTGNRNKVDISQWSPGIYLFKVANSEGIGVGRIVK
jgi:hypothetical protein